MSFPSDYFEIIIWINIYLCFPLTFLVIPLCFMVRLDHIPVSYYINLLISNLILIIRLVFHNAFRSPGNYSYISIRDVFPHYLCGGGATACFRMIFAVERFLFLYKPQFHFIRKTKGFVTFCVWAWILCIVLFAILVSLPNYEIIISIVFTAVMFTICLAATLKSLCVATSESAEEKYRVIGALVLVLVNYIFLILPMIVSINPVSLYLDMKICFTLSLHCPLLDFLLLGFMSKGPFIRLLMRLSCCRTWNPAENDSSRSDVGL